MMLLQLLIVGLFFPETRGVPLQEIANLLRRTNFVSADTTRTD
jgi:hypothetical protein